MDPDGSEVREVHYKPGSTVELRCLVRMTSKIAHEWADRDPGLTRPVSKFQIEDSMFLDGGGDGDGGEGSVRWSHGGKELNVEEEEGEVGGGDDEGVVPNVRGTRWDGHKKNRV